jgi:putative chitinase
MSVIPPTKNSAIIVDDFISYATLHLSTVSGIINTVSLYPPLGTPGPGVIMWTSYMVTPSRPGGAASTASETPEEIADVAEVDTTEIEMTDAQLVASEEASLEGSDINEASAVAYSVPEDAPIPTEEEQAIIEERITADAEKEPDPPLAEEEKPKDNIPPVPNYKTKIKVPTELVAAMRKYGLAKTPLERAHFLAQTNHESGNFVYKEEIASGTAYEGRKDLGNTQPGDGKRYKGRGYIQLTGRANYKKFGPIAGDDFEGNPTLVGSKYYADTACLFWKANKLGEKCKDSTTVTIKVITKRINGGYNGLDDRIKKFTMYWTELQKDPTLWA